MKHLRYSTFVLMAFLTVLGCGNGNTENAETQSEKIPDGRIKVTQAQFDQTGMVLGTLEEREFPFIVKATGMIDVPPENRSVVSATMGGYIKTLPLLIGDAVEKGQVLLSIENPEFVTLQQEYMEVSGQLDYLKSEYGRQKTLYDENITSQKSYLKAESDYKMARAKHDGLRKQLTLVNISPGEVEAGNVTTTTTLYAPISGSVTQVNVSRGSYVAPATPILEIIDNEHIHLELSVFEKDIMKIKKGQDIAFKIPEASSDTFEAEVYLVGTSIGEGRTIKVHGHLKDEEGENFLTGMFVESNIVSAATTARGLPSESIVGADNKDYVLVLDEELNGDYYFKPVGVKVKKSHAGFTALDNENEFGASDQFLVRGAFDIFGE
ncbi:efflux RND transporter periplasmic adaptor subunit [Pricia sp. S334]|uniref:Efflux RND transporter periplasmic adaptor subunit n=1 Tax=Pricia mediterranea TaxID=3076079 RepID=A0ABU3LAB6_9FLAO|nr:efflux RND transporter periplasmic adaptor subunit [Pricia sp. S334]MDT7830037.1 efflux RND transporter periplasmic adaptor subunit [Pricia sp. S334]